LRLFACALCASAVLSVSVARAQPTDSAAERRLGQLEDVLKTDQSRARTWKTVWMIAFGALTVGQGAFAVLTDDQGLAAEAGVGAVKSGLGFGALLIFPFHATSAYSDLEELPGRTPAERRAKLRAAEELLGASAQDEEFGIGWPARLASSAVNLAGAYYLWIEHERFAGGWLSLVTGMGVSEIQFRTQPTGALDEVSRRPTVGQLQPLTLSALPGPGLLLRGSF
jgi:hypothetical protein